MAAFIVVTKINVTNIEYHAQGGQLEFDFSQKIPTHPCNESDKFNVYEYTDEAFKELKSSSTCFDEPEKIKLRGSFE